MYWDRFVEWAGLQAPVVDIRPPYEESIVMNYLSYEFELAKGAGNI